VARASTVAPSRNSTFVTVPSGSLAVALNVIVGFHGNVVPLAGDVIAVLGATFARLTVIVERALVDDWPPSSMARAVSV